MSDAQNEPTKGAPWWNTEELVKLDNKIADSLGEEAAFIMICRADVLSLCGLLVSNGLLDSSLVLEALRGARQDLLDQIEKQDESQEPVQESSTH